jgi:phage terminase large subunit-like protein
MGRHTRRLNEALLDVAGHIEGDPEGIDRIGAMMPPQHGKSTMTSHYGPAWLLGNYPDLRIILGSYNDEFASFWGSKVRDVLNEIGPEIFGVKVRSTSRAVSRWGIEGHDGGMYTVGKGGSVTGRSAHVFIFDDPFSGPRDAESDTEREKAWNWYISVARTRLRPNGVIILIQTRWHEDDIAGRIQRRIEQGKTDENWTWLVFPAIADGLEPGEVDNLGRGEGEPLFPEVGYDLTWLKNQRQEMLTEGRGSYFWEALYQQRPIPLGGGIFKRIWERYYWVEEEGGLEMLVLGRPGMPPKKVAVAACVKFITVDLAAADTEGSAFNVIATWLLTPDRELVLWDLVRFQDEGAKQTRMIKRAHQVQRGAFVGVESVAYQLNEVKRLRSQGVPVRELKPGGRSKIGRALTAAAFQEAGNLYFPLHGGEEYMHDVQRELYGFPKAKTKDIVDVTAYAAIEAGKFPTGPPPEDALEELAHRSYWRGGP